MPLPSSSWISAMVALALVLPLRAQLPTLQWIERADPKPLMSAGCAYDTHRNVAVVFGGATTNLLTVDDTWEWDGARWLAREPAHSPPAASEAVMAYDAARRRTALFAGIGASRQTWEWDGDDWHLVAAVPATMPPGGAGTTRPAMSFDVARGVMLLFQPAGGVWQWDGTTWTSSASPLPSSTSLLCYDAARGVTLLTNAARQTWQWNGGWTQVAATGGPLGTPGGTMTFDAARGVVVLTASGTRRTWEWNGATWTQIGFDPRQMNAAQWFDVPSQRVMRFGGVEPAFGFGLFATREMSAWNGSVWMPLGIAGWPTAFNHDLAYDSARERVISHQLPEGSFGAQTLEWDGGRWDVLVATSTPFFAGVPPGEDHAIEYDPVRGSTLYFGREQTWAWDGAAWTRLFPATNPDISSAGAMVWDEARQQMVMFGGVVSTGGSVAETWLWNGTDWTQALPATNPPAASLPAMAYHAATQRVVMFNSIGQTWEWDGNDWLPRSPATQPSPPWFPAALAYDEVRQRTVMFKSGGGLFGETGETWEWDGNDWSRVTLSIGPISRHGPIVFDRARAQIVLYGGQAQVDIENTTELSDTWVYTSTILAANTSYGTGCAGSAGVPRLVGVGRPWLGNADYRVQVLEGAPSSTAFVLFALGPATIPLGSCTLQIHPGLYITSLGVPTSTSGVATIALGLPALPVFAGASLFTQALVADPAGPWNQLAFSNGLQIALGN